MSRVVLINGKEVQPATADIVETEPGVFSVLYEGMSYEVRIAGEEIAIGSHRLHYEIEDPRVWQRSGHAGDAQGKATIKSVMPGKVVRVLVQAGDQVEPGQGILVVEAMKMQNELKAPRAGTVTSINVKANDSVNAGVILVSIE